LEGGDHGRVGDEALRSGRLESRSPQQRPRFEVSAILRELEKRRAVTRPDDLNEPEAVDRGPLERLRKHGVDGRCGLLTRCLAAYRRQVDSDRAADVQAPDCPGRLARTG